MLSLRLLLIADIERSLAGALQGKTTKKTAKTILTSLRQKTVARGPDGTIWCLSAKGERWYRIEDGACSCVAILPCWHLLSAVYLAKIERAAEELLASTRIEPFSALDHPSDAKTSTNLPASSPQ